MGRFSFTAVPVSFGNPSFSVSVSSQMGLTADHDQRKYTPDSADKQLAHRNVYYKTTEDHKQEFNDFFREAIEDYNSTQKRKDRKKSLDYYAEVAQPEQEFVLQVGDRDSMGVLTAAAYKAGIDKRWRDAKQQGKGFDLTPWLRDDKDRQKVLKCLDKAARGLQDAFPGFHFTTIDLHDDEPAGTPHIHAGGFWVGEGYKQGGKVAGVQKRCSMTKALEDMGYKDISEFSNAMRDYMVEHMEACGLQRKKLPKNRNKRLPVDQFRELKEREAEQQRQSAAVVEQEEQLSARALALDAREKAVADKEATVAKRERAVEGRERAVEGREEAVGLMEVQVAGKLREALKLADMASGSVAQQVRRGVADLGGHVKAPQQQGRSAGCEFDGF